MSIFRTLLLGDLGNWLDTQDNKRRIREIGHQARRRASSTDAEQNRRIRTLEKDNDELRTAFATVVQLLQSKGVLSREEIQDLAEVLGEAETESL